MTVIIVLVILVCSIIFLFCMSACLSWYWCFLSNVFVLVVISVCDLYLVCCDVVVCANHLNCSRNMKSHSKHQITFENILVCCEFYLWMHITWKTWHLENVKSHLPDFSVYSIWNKINGTRLWGLSKIQWPKII